MELLLSFLIALSLIAEGDVYTEEEIDEIVIENYEQLETEYGEEFTSIIGEDLTEK